MQKLKIYLDTSVISHLDQPEQAEKQAVSLQLWDYFRQAKGEIYISDTLLDEIAQCEDDKRTALLRFIGEIPTTLLTADDDDVRELVREYIRENVLPEKFENDLTHLAIASKNHCHILLSWNFKHIVQNKTIVKVQLANKKLGYGDILLLSPFSFTTED